MSDKVLSQFSPTVHEDAKDVGKVLKFGIIGTGWIAESYIESIKKMDDIKVDDKGTVTGLDEQLKTVAEQRPFLWKTEQSQSNGKKSTELKTDGQGEKSVAQQLAETRLAQQKTAEASNKFFT